MTPNDFDLLSFKLFEISVGGCVWNIEIIGHVGDELVAAVDGADIGSLFSEG